MIKTIRPGNTNGYLFNIGKTNILIDTEKVLDRNFPLRLQVAYLT